MNRHAQKVYDLRTRDFADHVLVVRAEWADASKYGHSPLPAGGAWAMKLPGTRLYSVEVTVFGGHIAIAGDACAGNGFVSRMPQGLSWWVGQKSPDYLAEKFLEKSWHPALCGDELIDMAEDYGWSDEKRREVLAFAARCEAMSGSCYQAPDGWRLQEEIYDAIDGIPGWWYDPDEQGFLSAVQQRFRVLWDERG